MDDRLEDLKRRACRHIEAEQERLLALSARIHAHPELRFEEHQASGWLADYLESIGFQVERRAYGLETAFAARLGSGEPRVAVLCEYDALPGIGHACGHNVIGAAGAGAGVGLAAVIGELGGSVVVLGTPAEEGGGGKVLMGQAGAFDGLAAAMMVHPAGMDLTAMDVLAVSSLEVVYEGRAAHAAAFPHEGRNALDALVTAYSAVAQLRQHIRPTERVHGIITDGGRAPNIVPARAAGTFMVRSPDAEGLVRLKARVEACFRAGAEATGCQVELHPHGVDYGEMWSNDTLTTAFERNAGQLGRRLVVPREASAPVSGSTDMGNVSQWVPSIHPMLAVSPPDVPLHSVEFARWAASASGDRAVLDGAKALAMTAIDVLGDAGLRAAARAAFDTRAGRASSLS